MPLPGDATAASPVAAAGGATPLAATGEGGFTVREPIATKVQSKDGETRELRRLTPEEKASRRFRRSLVMMTLGILLLVGVFFALTYLVR